MTETTASPKKRKSWPKDPVAEIKRADNPSFTIPADPLSEGQIVALAIRAAQCLDGVAISQAVVVLDEAKAIILGTTTFRVVSPNFVQAAREYAPSSDE